MFLFFFHLFLCIVTSKVLTISSQNYVLVLEPKSWSDANKYCIDTYGTHLAIIQSLSDENEIYDNLSNTAWSYWVGLSDISTEDEWLWVDGSTPKYTNWYSGEPNNLGNEDCVELWQLHRRGWNDLSCSEGRYFICQLPTDYPTESEECENKCASLQFNCNYGCNNLLDNTKCNVKQMKEFGNCIKCCGDIFDKCIGSTTENSLIFEEFKNCTIV